MFLLKDILYDFLIFTLNKLGIVYEFLLHIYIGPGFFLPYANCACAKKYYFQSCFHINGQRRKRSIATRPAHLLSTFKLLDGNPLLTDSENEFVFHELKKNHIVKYLDEQRSNPVRGDHCVERLKISKVTEHTE
jgi:hypothetical protein